MHLYIHKNFFVFKIDAFGLLAVIPRIMAIIPRIGRKWVSIHT